MSGADGKHYVSDGNIEVNGNEVMKTESIEGGAMTKVNLKSIKRRKTASWVHSHFRVDEHKKRRVCMECLTNESTSENPRSYNYSSGTSTLGRHLKVAHKIFKDGAAPMDGAYSVIRSENRIEVHKHINEERNNEIQNALVDFIVDERQPCSVVEEESFKKLVRSLNRLYKVPNQRFVLKTVMDRYKFDKVRIMEAVNFSPSRVSLTVDEWSPRINQGYLAVTLHWIDVHWHLQETVIDLKSSIVDDSRIIFDSLKNVIKEWNLQSRIRAITTSTSTTVEMAVDMLRDYLDKDLSVKLEKNWHVRCICHIMKCAISETRALIEEDLTKLRLLLKMLHSSNELRTAFALIQAQLGWTPIVSIPPLYTEDTWQALYDMICRCYELKEIFHALSLTENVKERLECLDLSAVDWTAMKEFADFFEMMVRIATAESGQNYTTLSMQPLIVDSLQSHCNSTLEALSSAGKSSSLLFQAAEAVRAWLLTFKENLCSQLNFLAQILDPRIGNGSAGSAQSSELLRSTLAANYELDLGACRADGAEREKLDLFAEVRKSKSKDASTEIDEIDAYFDFTQKPDPSCKEIVQWWGTIGSNRFPKLSLLARDTLMIMGSSVPSDSAFGEGGQTLVRRDHSLSDESLIMMSQLKAWNRLLGRQL